MTRMVLGLGFLILGVRLWRGLMSVRVRGMPSQTRVLTVPVARPPMTANDQRRAHWTKVREAKRAAETLVFASAKTANLPKCLAPSHVSIIWFAPDKRRRDPDSLGCFLKACLDSLVIYGAWKDDSSEYILSTTTSIRHRRASTNRNPHHGGTMSQCDGTLPVPWGPNFGPATEPGGCGRPTGHGGLCHPVPLACDKGACDE